MIFKNHRRRPSIAPLRGAFFILTFENHFFLGESGKFPQGSKSSARVCGPILRSITIEKPRPVGP